MAPARLFPTGMKLSYRLQLNFISSRAVLSWCLSLRLIGFEMETPHLSPFPTHGAGALRSGGAEIPLGTSIPACLWVWHSGISAGGGNTGDKGRGKVFPRLVPPVPFGLSGWQRYLPYLPYPPSPALGCRAGLPGRKSRSRGWEGGGGDQYVPRPFSGRSLGLRFLTGVPGLEGCWGGGWGKKRRWVLVEKRLVGSPALPRAPFWGWGVFWGVGGQNPALAGLEIAKPPAWLCGSGRAPPWLFFFNYYFF